MNNMKKLFALILALCMVLCLGACGGENGGETTEGKETTTAPETSEATEETTAPVEDGKTLYTVTVVDQDGNPVAGAMVQLCLDACCPGITDENGVAEYSLEAGDYKVSFLSLPAGYTYSTEEQDFHFEDGSTEITLTLKAEG